MAPPTWQRCAKGDDLNQPAPMTQRPRHLLTQAALAALALMACQAHALGLGRLHVQSALGETLRAEIELTSLTPEEAAGLRVRVASPDAFRAQGLDYNAVLTGAQVQLVRQPDGRAVLRLVSERAVQEPFLDVLLDVRWATGRFNREFTLLFDPPNAASARPAEPISTPLVAAPVPAPPPQPGPAVAAPRPAIAAAPTPAPAPTPKPSRAPAAVPEGAIHVRPGDSLSRLAERHRPQEVSLDQMLVALYRGNSDAFIGGNMNLLRAGSRLRMPGREDFAALPANEARRLVRAHSSSFDTVRQGMATAAPRLPDQSERVARGAVQAQVSESKPVAPGSDRLTLTKPSASPASEATASQLASAARDVEALKKLADAAKQEVAPAASAPASAAPVAPTAASAASAAMPAPAAVALPAPGAKQETSANAEGGWLDWLLSPIGAAIGVALLVLSAAAAMRLGRRRKADVAQETMFGESRLQPDSFFGGTGGQRVDTRDASSGASSMSYSLSQLDAHGDVDPVAEADVYLAYGRDLQAEEILKEALRAQPERLAIRLKLLEVYAKRRDVRGYEQLATQLYAETKGSGEDWEKAQEMGRAIDPENPLYRAGGAPRSMFDDDAPRPEPMNATTLPQAGPMSLQVAQEAQEPDAGPPSLIDLDLDLGVQAPATPQSDALLRTQAFKAVPDAAPGALDMDLDISEPTPVEPKKDNSLEFDLTDLGDLGGDSTQAAELGDAVVTKVGGDSLLDAMQDLGDDADPVMRQLELADEFRQIGDVEGARDVLQELIAQVRSGPLYEKAKAMLEELR